MKIKDKWKVFAIGHFFCEELDTAEAVALFDRLVVCDTTDELQALLDERDSTPWAPFEFPDKDFPREVFPREVWALAEYAQSTAEESDLIDAIDWTLLREQKEYCVNEANNNPDACEIYSGIVHLMDHLQDFAAETLGDAAVFGYTVEEEA